MNHNDINRQCAEAMGLCWHEHPIEHPITLRVYCEKCNMLLISGDSGVMVEVNTNPDFRNDWNAMKMLVEYANKKLYRLRLEDVGTIEDPEWNAKFISVQARPFVCYEEAKTASLAVALAFLKCFGKEEE